MSPKASPNPRLKAAEALMALLADRGWSQISLADVALQAGISLAELRQLVSCKEALLPALTAEIDHKVLESLENHDETLPIRDRLFDVLMRRLEALAPYRPGLKRLAEEGVRAPLAGLAVACSIDRAMPWMLEAAGIGSSGLGGRIKAKALAAIYLSAVKVWLDDDSADLGKTMGALDKGFERAGRLMALTPAPLRACLFGQEAKTSESQPETVL